MMLASKDRDGWLQTPDSPGDWLWVSMWGCACCVMKCGMAEVYIATEMDHLEGGQKLDNGMVVFYVSPQAKDIAEHLEMICGWKKVGVPPKEWTEKIHEF